MTAAVNLHRLADTFPAQPQLMKPSALFAGEPQAVFDHPLFCVPFLPGPARERFSLSRSR
jgi:hypothetical protein